MLDICDIHGHFLPGMDDGCKTPEEAVQVLKSSYAQGIHRVFATPHYYPVESIEAFLVRRQEAAKRLEEYLRQQGQVQIPEICLGAEVAYRPGLGYEAALSGLCLGRSRYLLLEMPFERWGKNVVREVRNICNAGGVTVILAHIERYLDIQPWDTVAQLLELDVLVQMNAEYLLQFSSRRKGRKLLQGGVVQLLGSDCHNMTSRPPNLGKAIEYLQKRGMEEVLFRMAGLSNEIFCEAVGI